MTDVLPFPKKIILDRNKESIYRASFILSNVIDQMRECGGDTIPWLKSINQAEQLLIKYLGFNTDNTSEESN